MASAWLILPGQQHNTGVQQGRCPSFSGVWGIREVFQQHSRPGAGIPVSEIMSAVSCWDWAGQEAAFCCSSCGWCFLP